MDVTTVLVIDDQPLFRQGVRSTLEQHAGEFEVVGEASDGEEGLQIAASREPSVVILNAEVEGLDGLEAIRTSREDEEKLFYAIKYGAAAYLLKSMEPEELVRVTRQVAEGQYLINDSVLSKPVVASRVLKSFRDLADEVDQEVEPLFIPLSVREVEVLDYIAKGNSNKEIARAMSISDQTVKNHITSIMRKLAVNDRTQAVVYALRHGWIKA
jgi:DNA-binding NarL/FixJ family response regulator